MTLKFVKCQILYRYKTAYLWKIVSKKKFPTHSKSGSQHSHRTRSAFKNCAFVPKVNTDIYRKKSVNYQYMNTLKKISEATQDKSLKQKTTTCKEINSSKFFEILLREIIFQHTILSSPSLSLTLLLSSSFSTLIPYFHFQHSILNPSPL